jgi:hypothetical protein
VVRVVARVADDGVVAVAVVVLCGGLRRAVVCNCKVSGQLAGGFVRSSLWARRFLFRLTARVDRKVGLQRLLRSVIVFWVVIGKW